MPSILWRITLLLLSSSAVAIAADATQTAPPASEAPASAAASLAEEPPAEAPNPVPWLLSLYQSGDYQGVRTESLRLGYEGLGDPALRAEVDYLHALALYKLDAAPQANKKMGALQADKSVPEVAEMAELTLAGTWVNISPQRAATLYQGYLTEHPDGAWRRYAAVEISRSYALEGNFPVALSALQAEQIPVSSTLSTALSAPPHWKRPLLAAALSGAVPGAGQLYTRHPKEAFSAFTVNTIFLSGMAWAAHERAWPTFGVLAFFGVGFYVGNIYGAADSAIRANREIRDEVMESFEAELGPPPGPPLPSTP